MERNIKEFLRNTWEKKNSLLCVGLDTDFDKIPQVVKQESQTSEAIFKFNQAIIDATYDLTYAYKLNFAFYEAEGIEGWQALYQTVLHILINHPDCLIVGDAKRGDIGNTSKMYAKAIFDKLGFDAVTVNPYLGYDALKPFLAYKDKGIIILCRTSNPSAKDFQDLPTILPTNIFSEPVPLYQAVAWRVINEWNENGNCLLVMGGVSPDDQAALEALKTVRSMSDETVFLIPGIGAQGGDMGITVKAGKNSQGTGMIINSSRGIIYASSGEDFAEAARKAAKELRDQINQYR